MTPIEGLLGFDRKVTDVELPDPEETTEEGRMSPALCPRCKAEPIKKRGLGKRCYDQWLWHGKPDHLAPPLPPYTEQAKARRASGLELGRSKTNGDGQPNKQMVRKAERLAAYEQLTREKGMLQHDACAALGLNRAAGTDYEAEIVARTGETLIQAHKRLFFELVDAGLPPRTAAVFIGRHPGTGRQWANERARQQAVTS